MIASLLTKLTTRPVPRRGRRPRAGRCALGLASVLASVLVLTPTPAPREAAGRNRDYPFQHSVFSPELLIRNQRKIGLTPAQREVFIREMQQTQADLLPTQLEMSEASADLLEILEGPRVDEQAALEAARRVLELEQRIKGRHMVLLIRIKNLLTEEQQRRLQEIRDAE